MAVVVDVDRAHGKAEPEREVLEADGAAQASMGITTGDVDGDGILDIFVTAFLQDFKTLYRELGGGFF